MSNVTELASGLIDGKRLHIELTESSYGRPSRVTIHWPHLPTTCEPTQLDAVVATATRLLTNAVLELAFIQAASKPR